MQYPQIQFYRGSLVRLASGKLKQVEDLSSDDILDSVKHLNHNITTHQQQQQQHKNNRNQNQGDDGDDDDDDMHIDPVADFIEVEQDDDVEIDVNNNDDNELINNKIVEHYGCDDDLLTMTSDFDIYMDTSVVRDFLEIRPTTPTATGTTSSKPSTSTTTSTSSTSTSSMGSSTLNLSTNGYYNNMINPKYNNNHNHNLYTRSCSQPSSCPQTPSPNCLDFNSFNLLTNPNLFISSCSLTSQAQSVLIKFFLESSRTIVFIEVSIEHPFFVLHRGWSSWNPQRTYDKFGLKCRKLKIGDTCISLIRKRKSQQSLSSTSDQDLSTTTTTSSSLSSMTTSCSMMLNPPQHQQQQPPPMHHHIHQTTSMLQQAISKTSAMKPIHSIASMLKLNTNTCNNNNHNHLHNDNNTMTAPSMANTKLYRETMKL